MKPWNLFALIGVGYAALAAFALVCYSRMMHRTHALEDAERRQRMYAAISEHEWSEAAQRVREGATE